ncbi:MAG: hypothetical protein JO133_05240 [Burkholderiaceae bacterium]|nr:hypothetical protein [Burkholderiaceae bacterium]
MKPRYDAYYKAIPNLGRDEDASTLPQRRPKPRRIAHHPPLRQSSALEAHHPEIVQAVTLLWGYPEMDVYFEKLWLDDGNANPIAPEAMSELMLLAGVHRWLLPPRQVRNLASIYDACAAPVRGKKDLWGDVPPRR